MMFAAAIFVKSRLPSSGVLFRPILCHGNHPCLWRISTALSQGSKRRASTGEDSNTRFITARKEKNENDEGSLNRAYQVTFLATTAAISFMSKHAIGQNRPRFRVGITVPARARSSQKLFSGQEASRAHRPICLKLRRKIVAAYETFREFLRLIL
jgi:hypothetical protein